MATPQFMATLKFDKPKAHVEHIKEQKTWKHNINADDDSMLKIRESRSYKKEPAC